VNWCDAGWAMTVAPRGIWPSWSFATAMARINQALYEFALVGRGSVLSYARMGTWVGLPEGVLAQQVEDYHPLMAL